MLTLLLDVDFDAPFPAVDRSGFSNHGRVHSTFHVPDGREPGSGALRFDGPDSAVRFARGPTWQRLTVLAIEAWVFAHSTGGRRNIIEGDGSFALFINPDDTVSASYFSVADGAAGPAWNVVSSATHHPEGIPYKVPMDRWTKVVAYHDGLTRARLFVDDELVGERSDYRSGIGEVAGTGVVVGNWTLTSQFAFAGLIDRVRVWKRDPYAQSGDFSKRPIDPAARDYWDEIWACLRARHSQIGEPQLDYIGRDWEELHRRLRRAVMEAEESDRNEYLRAIETYRANWRANTIDESSTADAILTLRKLIERLVGDAWSREAESLARVVLGTWDEGSCLDPDRLAKLDPKYAEFINACVSRF